MYLVPYDYKQLISERARARRLHLQLTQEGLASRSGVSLGSIKRFERTGEISLRNLLQLALVLDALDDFQHLFQEKQDLPQSLDEILNKPKARQRGRIR
jgi:transcriptional regulator with XRE-family HTH domain